MSIVETTREAVKDNGVITYAWLLAEMNIDNKMKEILTDTDIKAISRIMKKIERV